MTDELSREGHRDNAKLDPEKLYVATIASSHMLTWLEIAFGMEIDVASYLDSAHGIMSELKDGGYWVSEVIGQIRNFPMASAHHAASASSAAAPMAYR